MRSADRPEVTIHFAQTLDGRIALPGAKAAISSEEGIVRAHRARAEHDAVLVGARTVAIDDPQLNVRACAGKQPRRVVLASTLAIASSAKLLAPASEGEAGPLLVIGAEGRATAEARAWLTARGAEALVVPAEEGWVSLPHALRALTELGVKRLLVEGGARVLTSFLRARLVDRAEIEIAPRLLGGDATAAVGALGFASIAATTRLDGVVVEHAGGNVLVRGDVVYAA
jgi:riboflavin-specific deaminase-like protein